jgi:hypothetical protein
VLSVALAVALAVAVCHCRCLSLSRSLSLSLLSRFATSAVLCLQTDAESILHRLRSVEAVKLSLLHHELELLRVRHDRLLLRAVVAPAPITDCCHGYHRV